MPSTETKFVDEAPLRVRATTDATKVAGAIANIVRAKGRCEAQAIGAGAINQTVKAIAIARGYVAAQGIDLVCVPTFWEVQVDGADRTALRFTIEPR